MKTCVDSYVCSSKMYCHLFSVNNLVVRRRSVKSVCTMRPTVLRASLYY